MQKYKNNIAEFSGLCYCSCMLANKEFQAADRYTDWYMVADGATTIMAGGEADSSK